MLLLIWAFACFQDLHTGYRERLPQMLTWFLFWVLIYRGLPSWGICSWVQYHLRKTILTWSKFGNCWQTQLIWPYSLLFWLLVTQKLYLRVSIKDSNSSSNKCFRLSVFVNLVIAALKARHSWCIFRCSLMMTTADFLLSEDLHDIPESAGGGVDTGSSGWAFGASVEHKHIRRISSL